jgi:hypothetical protein
VKNITILISILLLSNCENSIKEIKKDNEECFCDSIYYNKKGEDKEVLCYKGIDVYKLKYKNGLASILSRHNLNNSKYLYERLVLNKNSVDTVVSLYISPLLTDSILNITFIGPKVDSTIIYLSNSRTKSIYSETFKFNKVILNKKYLTDDQTDIKLVAYETVKTPNAAVYKSGVELHEIYYSSILKLHENNLDSILKKFEECIR